MGGLGPADGQGRYRRPAPAFGERPGLPPDAAAAGGHGLIVGRSCPWAHRAWLTWTLRGLGESIELVVAEPDPAAGRWRFATPYAGCGTLAELYRASGGDPSAPATVPALHSRGQGRILVNESARLIELLNAWPGEGPDLWPESQRPQIDTWRERLQAAVNDGVYRCGFARTQAAYEELVAMLSAHEIDRRYLTLVWGIPASGAGMIDAPIGRSHRDPTRMVVSAQGKEARTAYTVLETFEEPAPMALVECRLETGRTHQIRVHMAAIGHAVVGDERYRGVRPAVSTPRMVLHSASLRLDHPIHQDLELAFESPLPADLASVVEGVRAV